MTTDKMDNNVNDCLLRSVIHHFPPGTEIAVIVVCGNDMANAGTKRNSDVINMSMLRYQYHTYLCLLITYLKHKKKTHAN